MLTIWGRQNSSNVQKVLWCCAARARYKRIDAGLRFGVNETPDLWRCNSQRDRPDARRRWLHCCANATRGLFTIWQPATAPAPLPDGYTGTLLCSTRWTGSKKTYGWPPVRPFSRGSSAHLRRKRGDRLSKPPSRGRPRRTLETIDDHLATRDYVKTGHFTIGDIPMGPCIYRWFALGDSRATCRTLRRYHDRLAERPGFRVRLPLHSRSATDLGGTMLMACGLSGEPVPPVMINGGPQKKNS